MIHLDLYDVLAVAARVLQVEPATVIGSTDLEAVAHAVEAARSAAEVGDDLPDPGRRRRACGRQDAPGADPDRVCAAGAALLIELVVERPFATDNRRVAVAVLLQLAAANDFDLDLEPVTELDVLMDRVSARRTGVPEVAAALRERLRERSLAIWSETSGEQEDAVFELFSESARQVVVLAQEEARMLSHNYVGTEHLLLGLIHQGDNVAASVLADAGISAAAVRSVVTEIIGRGQTAPSGHIPFTPRAKRALEQTRLEARKLGSEEFRPEHLLLGLIADSEGVASKALVKLGVDLALLRRRLTAEHPRLAEHPRRTEHRRRAEAAVQGYLSEDEHSGMPWTARSRRRHLIAQLKALLDENDELHDSVERLRAENQRLRDKLQANDLDPDA